MRLEGVLRGVLSRFGRTETSLRVPPQGQGPGPGPVRGRVDHVIVLDGTMSSLRPGEETNAGRAYQLLREAADPASTSFRYEGGVQWESWRTTRDIVEGRGINRQIRRMYGFLTCRYRPGDRIFLLGYSRGAYAVRSLAGVIDSVGLLAPGHATERNILLAWRHYERARFGAAHRAFTRRMCHPEVAIEMVGVWDTVKALGLRAPLLAHREARRHAFHNHALGQSIRHGYQALALHETRAAFAPILWETPDDWPGHVEQMWFAGTHSDIGGQLGGMAAARPRANIPLVWMLEKAEGHGLALPGDWRARLPCDAGAPSVSSWRGWGKLFLARRRRVVGADPSERVHPTAGGAPGRAAPGLATANA